MYPVRVNNNDDVATIVTASSTAAAGAMTASLPAAGAGYKTWIASLMVTGAGATAASTIEVAIAGAGSGTMTFKIPVPAGATVAIPALLIHFDPPIPATAANAAITCTVPSFGSGNTAAAVVATGFQQRV